MVVILRGISLPHTTWEHRLLLRSNWWAVNPLITSVIASKSVGWMTPRVIEILDINIQKGEEQQKKRNFFFKKNVVLLRFLWIWTNLKVYNLKFKKLRKLLMNFSIIQQKLFTISFKIKELTHNEKKKRERSFFWEWNTNSNKKDIKYNIKTQTSQQWQKKLEKKKIKFS